MKCIKFEREKKYMKDFLSLPKRLYKKNTNMENPKEVENLLKGIHPLSKYFVLHKFLVYEEEQAVARFVITIYPEDDIAYLGFFECENEKNVASFLFQEAVAYAKKVGCKKMVGPVDASFWIKYRLKINHFESEPYTGEPYNLDYYHNLFRESGFEVCQHYTTDVTVFLQRKVMRLLVLKYRILMRL